MEKSSKKISKFIEQYMLEVVIVVMIVFMSFLSPHFLKVNNIMNILRNISLQGIVAFGMTLTIVCGELDLSVPYSVATAGVLTALIGGKLESAGIMPLQYGAIVGILVSCVFAAVVGLINGICITKFRIPAMIATIAMNYIIYGFSAFISKGYPVTTLPSWLSVIGSGKIFGVIPVPVIFLLIVFAITFYLLKYTKYGRACLAVGGNAESARLSGINVVKTKIITMIIVQVCCVLSGVLLSGQVMSGTFSFAKGWEMTAISSVVIGGSSIAGGTGNVKGTFLGIIFLGIILNGMTLMNVNDYLQYVVRGVLMIGAVMLNAMMANKNRG